MRIISGIAGGRKLREPVGDSIRPTSDYVKESVFNIIQFDIEGRRVLDLFAGTGQIGIEALSRGAKSAVFIDSSSQAINLIKANLEHCKFLDISSVRAMDALRYLGNDEKFDLIYIDPPYNTELAESALLKIVEFDKMNINGIILTESSRDKVLPDLPPPYELVKAYMYGSKKITKHIRISTD